MQENEKPYYAKQARREKCRARVGIRAAEEVRAAIRALVRSEGAERQGG